ncbi:selenocysteine insertion sequence-binding protein 2-like isoform X2 [Scleropages formosus]|uniref:Selenocysteine insertion sequence-binding protein 2 n=1 Tax=Scleropages formosus TaxID=113540 RepID=A0A8C9RLV0_SCLFO|nr:selenocysteine insertion sequence-binding protein 2 isoform X2 [Scleropages formosus]
MKPRVNTLQKESKLSPEVEPFVPKQRKDQHAVGSPCPPDACSTEARRHAAGGQSPVCSQESPSALWPRQKTSGSKHGYSSSRRARRVPQNQGTALERTLSESPRKASRLSNDLICLEKKSPREPAHKREGSMKEQGRRPKSTPHPPQNCETQRADADPFQVDLSDFPELTIPTAKTRLGRRSPSPGAWPSASSSPSKSASSRKGPPADSCPNSETPDNRDVKTKPGQGRTQEPTAPGPVSPATSWAAVACQPPRRLQPNTLSLQEEAEAQVELEQTSERKKKNNKKKKKKKSKQTDYTAEAEPEAPGPEQEPPKFEDEEEFPDLAHAIFGSDKGQGPTRSIISSSNVAKSPKGVRVSLTSDKDGDLHRGGDTPADSRGGDRTLSETPQTLAPPTDGKKGQKPEKPGGKKSKVPVQLDLGNMLAVLEQKQMSQKSKQNPKPIILSVGGGLPVLQKDPSTPKKHPRQVERVAHNPLDSTSPLVKKGKQREVPKAKKPTPLKRIILKEREERKRNRLLEERGLLPPAADSGPCSNEVVVQLESLQLEEIVHSSTDVTEESMTVQVDLCTQDDPAQAEIGEQPTNDGSSLETALVQRPKIHSRKFRDYCSQVLSKEVDECVTALLKELVRFQDRLYQKDPMKARMKRRLVMGLREVLKHLKLRKVKCVVISPNCERIQSKGGLDEALHTIIDTCREQSVPFVFALSRKALGRCVNKAVPVSLVGIFNYDGAQDLYHKMIELSSEARKTYEEMIATLEKPNTEPLQVPVEQKDVDSTLDQSEMVEPEYIKVWKKMLEKESNHRFLYFEEPLSTAGMADEPGLQIHSPGPAAQGSNTGLGRRNCSHQQKISTVNKVSK